jgi:hypothetical protein
MEQAERFYAELVGRPVSRHQTMSRFAPAETNEPALNEQAYGSAEMWEQTAAPFQVKLTDPQAITAQAREQVRWAGDRVQLELIGGGVQIAQQVSPNGLFEIPSGHARRRRR